MKGFHCPLPPRQRGSGLQEIYCPLPPGRQAVSCRTPTAHRPQAVRQCIAVDPLSTALRQAGSVAQDVLCTLPQSREAEEWRGPAAYSPGQRSSALQQERQLHWTAALDRRQWPCTPGAATADPQRGSLWNSPGMVLVLAADMVRGVLHASRVRRARPQWTIQVYTPPRTWSFSMWAVLVVMWHLAPENAPTGTAEEIARDLHTWPADQDYSWGRPRGGLAVAPAAEGLSLAATLQRQPDKRARHFLQTGTVPAAPPDSEWRWNAREAQPLPDPWVLPLWYLPMGTLAHATQAVKGAFPQPLLPGVALLRSLQAGAAWVQWREGGGRSSPYFPLVQGQVLLHAKGMGTVEWGAIVPGTACSWITAAAPQPMRSPPACDHLLRMVPSLAPQHAFTRDVWRAILSHTREWLTNPGAHYPPGPVLEQLTAPTPGVRHALHRASALTEHFNDEVLDLALEPL